VGRGEAKILVGIVLREIKFCSVERTDEGAEIFKRKKHVILSMQLLGTGCMISKIYHFTNFYTEHS